MIINTILICITAVICTGLVCITVEKVARMKYASNIKRLEEWENFKGRRD